MEPDQTDPVPQGEIPNMGFGPIPDLNLNGDAKSGCSISCSEVNCGSPVLPHYECPSLTCPSINIGDVKCGDVNIGSIHCSSVQPPVYQCDAVKCPDIRFPEYKCPAFNCPSLPPCPQCINTSTGVVVMIIILVSLMAILILFYKIRKNRQSVNNSNAPRLDHQAELPPLLPPNPNPIEMQTQNMAVQSYQERIPQFISINRS